MSWDKITEQQNSASANIDENSTLEILSVINNEDAKVALAIQNKMPEIEAFIDALVSRIQKGGRLFYVGSGTSGRLGVLDAAECPPTFSTDPELIQGIIAGGYDALVKSIEGAEDSPTHGAEAILEYGITVDDAVLGITASSTTPFVLGALEKAKKIGAMTGLLLCNNPPKLKYVDHIISIIVGPEVITGSTRMKAGTATKMVLNMVTTTLMIKLNKTYGNLMVDLKASNEKLWDRGTRIIQHLTDLGYDDSLKLLQSADGEVKTAIVMEKMKVGAGDAREMLSDKKGSLQKVLMRKCS
ncbi:MAG: N-acetylmuramic acid 6-phosphate etherase [Candidatus Marinimicrobia bacterium]|nr:N-acetylmuramic acid 6-phosphate etherase [Candidatus Neomarinimicrobiota bacterium]